MKAVQCHDCGDPSVLRDEDVDRPRPAAGQVLLRVAATAFNPVDATMRAGPCGGSFRSTCRTRPGTTLPARSPRSAKGGSGARAGTT